MITHTLKTIGLVSLLAGFGTTAMAATDGSLGTSSSASININLTVLEQLQIHSLQDINMQVAEDSNPANASAVSQGCVYANTPSGYYSLKSTSRNGQEQNGQYQLKGSSGQQVGYSLSAASNGSSYGSLANGQSQTFKASNTQDCSGGKNLNIKMQLDPNAELKPGSYHDVNYLQVNPI